METLSKAWTAACTLLATAPALLEHSKEEPVPNPQSSPLSLISEAHRVVLASQLHMHSTLEISTSQKGKYCAKKVLLCN